MVWGLWFGVALLFWVVTSAEGYLVNFILTTPGSMPAPIPFGYAVALGIWGIVLNLALMPFAGYFVQQRVKSFDPTGIFVMTLAAGLLVGIAPMTIARLCTTSASPTCSYQFDLGLWGQSYVVVSALTDALGVSLVIMAGAFLSRWHQGAITIVGPARSKSPLLAAWLVVGFVAVGAQSVANASTIIVISNPYLLDPLSGLSQWYDNLVRLLSGPMLAVCLGYFLYSRLRKVGMGELFSTVALGGMLASVITQAAYGITLARMPSVVFGTIVVGIFPAWIVLSGCLLSIFEKGRTRSDIDEVASLGHQDTSGRLSYPTLAVGFAVTIVFYVLGILSQTSLFDASFSFRQDVGQNMLYGLLIGLFIVFAGFALLYSEHQAKKAVVGDAAGVP